MPLAFMMAPAKMNRGTAIKENFTAPSNSVSGRFGMSRRPVSRGHRGYGGDAQRHGDRDVGEHEQEEPQQNQQQCHRCAPLVPVLDGRGDFRRYEEHRTNWNRRVDNPCRKPRQAHQECAAQHRQEIQSQIGGEAEKQDNR